MTTQWAEEIVGPPNNKMQRTSYGQDGGSPLILVLGGPQRRAATGGCAMGSAHQRRDPDSALLTRRE
jgi:hypothetical protein